MKGLIKLKRIVCQSPISLFTDVNHELRRRREAEKRKAGNK